MTQTTSVPISVLFVCLGNICRSPMAEGMFRQIVEDAGVSSQFHIDSAGTGSWHIGRPPDPRAQQAMASRGIDISSQRARQIEREDFYRFDLLLAMDRSNYYRLLTLAPDVCEEKVRLFLSYAPEIGVQDVPDPYFGGTEGFAYVLQLVEFACRGLLNSALKEQAMPLSPYVR